VIELYAIAEQPAPEVPSPLQAVPAGSLVAVCGPADDEVTPEALWQRETVLEGLMADGNLLPVRYGTRLEDEEAAARAVEERREHLAAALERVRGAVELSVRVVGDAGGTVHEPLRALARDAVVGRPQAPESHRAAYLVDRARIQDFVDTVAALQRTTTNLQVLCTGPWPPYSFTTP
jgi:Gas vesicle synthesis protein GvpL/GvpF